MNYFLRIKEYLHILEVNKVIEFIKTLDEGPKLPTGDLFDTLLSNLNNSTNKESLLNVICDRLSVSTEAAEKLLDKLFELRIIEYYKPEMPENLKRYSRQLLLFDSIKPQEHFENNYVLQNKLRNTHALILGIGGIGNFIATALTMAGVGRLTLVDFDRVEETNLNRQILFSEINIGENKVDVARNRLKELNSKCEINVRHTEIHSKEEFEKLLNKCDKVDYIVLSADKPVDLVLWASALCKKYQFKYIKCGYMSYQGLVGPLLGYHTKPYEEIFQSWSEHIRSQSPLVVAHNDKYIAPSMAATNSILANIAAWEIIKDITEIFPSVLTERRILFNLKTMELKYG